MHEWLEGLQKSAKRMVAGVEAEDIRRAETECGVPFPEELGALYRMSNGGEFLGEVVLFPLHGPEGAPSVLEKTRLKLESLPAAGLWRIGVKGPHRQLFVARKSAMVEQSDSPLPDWAESLSGDDSIFGTWETEARELRLYRSLREMLEVLVPPAEVEEFGDRTYARALSAVQGALSDLSVEYEEGEAPRAAAQEEGEEELRQMVVAAAERRVEQLRQSAAQEQAEPVARPQGVAKKAAAGARRAVKRAASVVEGAAKTAASVASTAAAVARSVAGTPARGGAAAAKKAAAKKAPAKKAAAKKAAAKKAAAKKAAAKKAAAKKAPAKKAVAKKAPAKKAPAKKAAAKKAPAKKAVAKKAPAKKVAP